MCIWVRLSDQGCLAEPLNPPFPAGIHELCMLRESKLPPVGEYGPRIIHKGTPNEKTIPATNAWRLLQLYSKLKVRGHLLTWLAALPIPHQRDLWLCPFPPVNRKLFWWVKCQGMRPIVYAP